MSTIRRHARLRREYLYKKSLEGPAKLLFEQKQAVAASLASGKPLPTELRAVAGALQGALALDDDVTGTAPARSALDDEYAQAGATGPPRIIVTTSRDPSSRLRAFCVEVCSLFPSSQRINRGNTTMVEIIRMARDGGFSDVIFLNETRGEPDGLTVSHLPYGPTAHFSLSNAVLRHDIANAGNVSLAVPHLIFAGFTSTLGARLQRILTSLFPAPKEDSKRVLTFANESDYISFRHHVYEKAAGAVGKGEDHLKPKDVVLTELGPRFELRPYKITLGTADQTGAETEWVMRPYMNTARKRTAL